MPPPRAIRPISNDCSDRCALARPLPLRICPDRGLNLSSSSAIAEDMRPRAKALKYLANERRKSAVPCVGKAAQSPPRANAETDSLPEKRCADKHIAAFLRRAEIRFILPLLLSFSDGPNFVRKNCFSSPLVNANSSANGIPGRVRILPARAIILAPDCLPEVVERPPLSGKIRKESERESQGQSAPHWPCIRLICRLVHGGQSALPQVSHSESHEERIENTDLRRKLP